VPQRTLHEALLELLTRFMDALEYPSLKAVRSRPQRSREDPQLYTGAGGYSLVFLQMHKLLLCLGSRKEALLGSDAQVEQVQSYDFLRLA
jgi:hypothetical protein